MIDILKASQEYFSNPNNVFSPEAIVKSCDSVIENSPDKNMVLQALHKKANALLQLGEEQKAISIFQNLITKTEGNLDLRQTILKDMAIAYLRSGERTNCIHNHSAQSCIYPIAAGGVHHDKIGSQKAIELYETILKDNPGDVESKWLLNIAYMTVGGYPQMVPPQYLVKISNDDSLNNTKAFMDVAANIGLNYKSQAGGCIIDDFNNDDYPDIVLSSWSLDEPMRYYINNKDGSFKDASDSSGLSYLTGGLNMMQTDYNNDGLKDIFVLRGAWKDEFGKIPNSLLRNNGDGTFTDVTKQSGMLSYHPTQTATWADFNNDGWLDVFIGNETTPGKENHPCELYLNNKNGTFTNVAAEAGCAFNLFVKGVTSGDYNNDGFPDIFISTLNGNKILLKNESVKNGSLKFEDVSRQAGLTNNITRTFPTWFWDYNNDGWLDIIVCGYEFTESLAFYAGAEAAHLPVGNAGKIILFKNKHDGTFEDVSSSVGLNKIAFAMGCNFGDINNDGYLDFYVGTGNPNLTSAVPNKMFKNVGGNHFTDVTTCARVGNLQKGHAVSFVDLDNDGDEDIYIKMGGAYKGDAYENSLYLNQDDKHNNWINISLEGNKSNKIAVGAKITLTFSDSNKTRQVYREVNSGASFGANPLCQHIGVGGASVIQKVEIVWPATNSKQLFTNVPVNTNIKINEAQQQYAQFKLTRFDFIHQKHQLLACSPN